MTIESTYQRTTVDRACRQCGEEFRTRFNWMCDQCVEAVVKYQRGARKKQHKVYGLWLEGMLVYIGYTSNPETRVQGHAQDGKPFDMMMVITGSDNKEEALMWERVLIKYTAPTLNRQTTLKVDVDVATAKKLARALNNAQLGVEKRSA